MKPFMTSRIPLMMSLKKVWIHLCQDFEVSRSQFRWWTTLTTNSRTSISSWTGLLTLCISSTILMTSISKVLSEFIHKRWWKIGLGMMRFILQRHKYRCPIHQTSCFRKMVVKRLSNMILEMVFRDGRYSKNGFQMLEEEKKVFWPKNLAHARHIIRQGRASTQQAATIRLSKLQICVVQLFAKTHRL